ncbi:MAG: succinylglutamate desuccinylase/aspartoacylase family protein [Glaciimonas sp.]|nr:succinylglutamate desuccinylase/aspartoacylase family protein [Glaciimonas sp.]
MRMEQYPLPIGSANCQYSLTSFHYGQTGAKKVYLQASLHADELPGMLVLHHLRPMLEQAEAEGRLQCEIVVVPVANPIGLGQTFMHDQMGRFDFASGANFNRSFPDLSELLITLLVDSLSDNAQHNMRLIRAGMRQLLDAVECRTPLDGMRIALMRMAHDADIVLDLHCDCEAVLHIYASLDHVAEAELLGRHLGARVILIADAIGGGCFDEMLFKPWLRLREHFGAEFPVPQSCFASTVELRGEQDVSHQLASADALGIYRYLCSSGMIADGTADAALATLAAVCAPTPLTGSVTAYAPESGVMSYVARPGDALQFGDVICDIVDPLTGRTHTVTSPIDGVMYSRVIFRYATRGMGLAKIAGKLGQRSEGSLLGP